MSALHRFFTEEIPADEIVEVTQQANAELIAIQARLENLKTENSVMYAAILEASELGKSAAMRCKVELQRIARNEAK